MRGAVDGLRSPFPMAGQLPAVYADDPLLQRLVAGFDDVVAPLVGVLDCFDSYLSPALAPADFVAWLGEWVGAEVTGEESDVALRAAVAAAARLHRARGTVRGVAEAVRLCFGAEPEITESGGAAWSARPRGPIPGEPVPRLHVVVRLPDPRPADAVRLQRLVESLCPAHVPATVEIRPEKGAA